MRATTLPTVIGDVEGLLAGFADDQLGPDTETALGALDDGGGRDAFGGLGGGGSGGGATCGRYWKQLEDGRMNVVETNPCEGATLAHGRGSHGYGHREQPDLGDKPETRVTPTVVTGKPAGCLTREACPWKEIIGKVIRRHKRELQYCYESTLERQQQAFDAQMHLSLGIAPEGGQANVAVASTSGISSFDSCVEERVARWIFPKTGFPIRANYPFRFAVL